MLEKTSTLMIKDSAIHERPREKAIKFGIQALSNAELIAILLRSGCRGTSVIELANRILIQSNGLNELAKMSLEELTTIKGISFAKGLEILASFELSKRVSSFQLLNDQIEMHPKEIACHLNKMIGFEQQENFYVLFMNVKNHIVHEQVIFVGSLNSSVVHPREVFKVAILKSAARIIIAHNHPSKNCIPSQDDFEVTKCIYEVGEMMKIPLLDRIIVSHNDYFSFVEHNLFEKMNQ